MNRFLRYLTLNKLLLLMVVNQMSACYLAGYHHQVLSSLLINSEYLFTVDGMAEMFGMLSRIVVNLVLLSMGYKFICKSYFYFVCLSLFSSVCLVISMYVRIDAIVYISWCLNRIFMGAISSSKDYIIFKEACINNLNVPMIKALKTVGNIFVMAHIYYFFDFNRMTHVHGSAMLIVVGSIALLMSGKIFVDVLWNQSLQHDDNDGTISENNNVVCDSWYVTSVNIFKQAWNNIVCMDMRIGFLVFITVFLLLVGHTSDQIIYLKQLDHGKAIKYKFIGQTIFGYIYSFCFGNSMLVIPATIIFNVLAHMSFMFEPVNNIAGVIFTGLTTQLRNSVCILSVLLLSRNNVYLLVAQLSEAISFFVAGFIVDLKFFSVGHLMHMNIIVFNIVCGCLVMLIIFKFRKK